MQFSEQAFFKDLNEEELLNLLKVGRLSYFRLGDFELVFGEHLSSI